ncbi:VanZ family protein [Mesorhizobium sp. UC22_110]|jgi:VanZ family protein|uniref:VanZ family protein n=1 Tax=unclassified Mesorhizobium TaxID=325217 RepID=UPI003672D2D1
MILLYRLASIFLLALIVFATLSPIGLRPHLGDANLERALAYMLLGSALALSFPRHTLRIAVFVVSIATVLELLQLIDPGRHGRIEDMVIKAAAGLIGIATITLAGRLLRRSPTQNQ